MVIELDKGVRRYPRCVVEAGDSKDTRGIVSTTTRLKHGRPKAAGGSNGVCRQCRWESNVALRLSARVKRGAHFCRSTLHPGRNRGGMIVIGHKRHVDLGGCTGVCNLRGASVAPSWRIHKARLVPRASSVKGPHVLHAKLSPCNGSLKYKKRRVVRQERDAGHSRARVVSMHNCSDGGLPGAAAVMALLHHNVLRTWGYAG